MVPSTSNNGDELITRLMEVQQILSEPDFDDEDEAEVIAELEAIRNEISQLKDAEYLRAVMDQLEPLMEKFSEGKQLRVSPSPAQMEELRTLKQLRDKSTDPVTREHYSKLIAVIEERVNPAPRITMDMDFETTCHTLNEMIERGEGYIGQRKVHKEQIEACQKVYEAFNSDKPPLLIAQPQQGKTDVCLLTIFTFLKYLTDKKCEVDNGLRENKFSYEIIYLTNIADNDLRDQNQDRAEKLHLPGWLMEHVKIIHHRALTRVHPIPNAVRLIIDDECHVALGNDKPFHEFLKRFGIEYGKPRSKWKERGTMLLSVSATPYPQTARMILESEAFTPVMLGTSPKYYSLNHIVRDERLKQAEPITRKTQGEIVPSDFFKERVAEFRGLCQKHGNGYMVVRATGARAEAVKNHFKFADGILLPLDQQIEVRDFHCELGNTSKLNECLRAQPPYPTVVIIRGTLRAGKTLSTTKHIRLWIESAGSKTDTLVQSGVGRSLGYAGTDGHSKFDDSYPIYCNAALIDDALAFYDQFYEFDGIRIVPRGNWNDRVHTKEGYRQVIAPSMDDVPLEIRNSAYWGRQSKVSANNKKDLARYILQELKPTGKAPVIVVDGPNPNHLESWHELLTRYPDIQGSIVYYQKDEQAPAPDASRKDSMLRK